MIAFLGTTTYVPCNYTYGGEKVPNVCFVQEAIARLMCRDWEEDDRILVFLTREAREMNWMDTSSGDTSGSTGKKKGLKSRLDSIGLLAKVEALDIPSGNTEKEIWEIFRKVFDNIREGDEILFDITHAFRSIPMLAIIILQYARVMKDVTLAGVYYGALQSLGTMNEIRKMRMEDRNAPIFDLTPFVSLMLWTEAIDSFIRYGDAERVSELAREEAQPILVETGGKDEAASKLRVFANRLECLTRQFRTGRGVGLIDFDYDGLRDMISLVEESCNVPPLLPLFARVRKKIEGFANDDVRNGFRAVEWCLEHGLIQQGITLLYETINSHLIDICFGHDLITDRAYRKAVNRAIYFKNDGKSEDEWDVTAKEKRIIQAVIPNLDPELAKIYELIGKYRNDINHGGFKDGALKPGKFEEKLSRHVEEVKRIVMQ